MRAVFYVNCKRRPLFYFGWADWSGGGSAYPGAEYIQITVTCHGKKMLVNLEVASCPASRIIKSVDCMKILIKSFPIVVSPTDICTVPLMTGCKGPAVLKLIGEVFQAIKQRPEAALAAIAIIGPIPLSLSGFNQWVAILSPLTIYLAYCVRSVIIAKQSILKAESEVRKIKAAGDLKIAELVEKHLKNWQDLTPKINEDEIDD